MLIEALRPHDAVLWSHLALVDHKDVVVSGRPVRDFDPEGCAERLSRIGVSPANYRIVPLGSLLLNEEGAAMVMLAGGKAVGLDAARAIAAECSFVELLS